MVESFFESCFFKSFMACVMGKNSLKTLFSIQFWTLSVICSLIIGYGLGAAIGLFSSSVNPNIAVPGVPEKEQTAREIFREMRKTTHGYAKNFSVIGLMFAGVECTIESVRNLFSWHHDNLSVNIFFDEILVSGKKRLEKWHLCRRRDRWANRT